MSTGVGDHPQAPFHMFNYDGLKGSDNLINEIDCGDPVVVEKTPDSVTLGDLCLSADPQFYTDNFGNFVVVLSCAGGYFEDDCSISQDGIGIVTMKPDANYSGQVGIKCAFGPNDALMPPSGQYFWIEIKVPAKKGTSTAKTVKWAYKRRSR